jgi:hypothetical protein
MGSPFILQGGRVLLDQDLELSVDAPCALLIEREGEDAFTVSVSDPTGGSVKAVALSLGRPNFEDGAEASKSKGSVALELPQGEYLGSTVTCLMTLQAMPQTP